MEPLMAKLLVIDDEASIRFSIAQVFGTGEFQVVAAENAEQGLEMAASELPDVLLLDIRLGKQSGLNLLEELRKIAPDLPVVLITGVKTAESFQRAANLNAFDYLVKPLDVVRLRQVVDRAIAK